MPAYSIAVGSPARVIQRYNFDVAMELGVKPRISLSRLDPSKAIFGGVS